MESAAAAPGELPGPPDAPAVAVALVEHVVASRVVLRPADLVRLGVVEALDREGADGVDAAPGHDALLEGEGEVHPLAAVVRISVEPGPGSGREVVFHSVHFNVRDF